MAVVSGDSSDSLSINLHLRCPKEVNEPECTSEGQTRVFAP